MTDTSIAFLGATDTVTGSRFLITHGETRILVDAGLFQGHSAIRQRNWEPFPVDPQSITAAILTHAHLDHCGYLPLLVKKGFAGQIHCTEYTKKLAEIILLDSARIMTEDAKYASRKGYSKHKVPLPLYTEVDVDDAMQSMMPTPYRTRKEIAPDCFVTFHPAGHILGSAFVLLEVGDKKLLFTGDMGRGHHPLLADPDPMPKVELDALITESTYGDRVHDAPTSDFVDIINRTIARGGSVLIPAFAVDRTEVILMKLRECMESSDIPKVPIYVDSPMALTSLDFYREAVHDDSDDISEEVSQRWHHQDPFDTGTLHEMRTVEQSKSLNNITRPSIIVSASGMATGGRVVHHLEHMLPNPKNTVMLVGYQASGTRGQLLASGIEKLKTHGVWVDVQAEIATIESFSVHADGDELMRWFGQAPAPKHVFVVHGEQSSQMVFANRLARELGWPAQMAQSGQEYPL